MKRLFHLLIAIVLLPSVCALVFMIKAPRASALAYNPAYLISNNIFTDANSMTANDIQTFLNNEGSGIRSLTDTEACDQYDSSYYTHCSQTISAAQIIYDAGQVYGINPRSILATLQKEQSLVTDPTPWQQNGGAVDCAMGYNSCSGYSGFFTQVDWGTYTLAYNYQGALRNTSWHGFNPAAHYPCSSGPNTNYSTGLYPGNTVTFYNPGGTPVTVTLANAATASLYCYTPYVGPYSQTGYSGSYNFVTWFETWWGSVSSPCYNDSNVTGATGPELLKYNYAGADRLALALQNNTGTTCAEVHVEGSNAQNWIAHIATGMRASDPTKGMLLPSKSAPSLDGQVSLNYIIYSGGGGTVEIHRFSPTLGKMPGYYDMPTNLGSVSPTTGTFVAGDFFGLGYDQLVYVLYNGASGSAEFHMFNSSLSKAVGFYDLISNIGNVTKDTGVWVAGDFFHRGYDQMAYITYGATSVHVLDIRTGKVIRMYEQDTNLQNTSSTTGTFIAGDFLGRGYDQLYFVVYSGFNGHVETHLFNSALNNAVGSQDLVTNIVGFSPSN